MDPEDEWLLEEDELPSAGMTLDRIDIVGDASGDDSELREAERAETARARGFDTPEDVAASIARKGAVARPPALPDVGLGVDAERLVTRRLEDKARRAPGRERMSRSAESARDLAEALDDTLGLSAAPTRAREAGLTTTADWLESGTAGGTGAVQGATMGFADEIGGAVAGAGALLEGDDAGEAYSSTRDRMRRIADSDREASPTAYGMGELTGALATAPLLPGIPGGRAATMAGRLGRGAMEGAAYGAAGGFGNSDGDLTTSEGREDALVDTAIGGAGGGIFGAAGTLAGEGLGAGANALRRHAARADELRAIAPAGGLRAGADAMRSSGTVADDTLRGPARDAARTADAARRVREMGLGGVNTAEGLADAAGAARRRFGEEIGATRGVLENVEGGVPVARLRDAMLRHADELARTTSGAPLADAVRNRAERLAEVMGTETVPYSRAVEELQGLGRDLNWTNRAGSPVTAPVEAGRRLYGAVRSELDDWARPVLGDEGLAAYRNSRANERVAISADEAAREAANRVGSNRGLSLSDYVMGTGGTAASGATGSIWPMVAGAGAMLGNRAMRLREPTLRAASAEGVRSLLETRGAAALGEYGPAMANALRRGAEVFMGTHAALMRADPDYAATVEAATADEGADPDWAADFIEEEPTAETPDWAAEFIEE